MKTNAKATGSVAIVLHTHLPWVLSHGRWPHGTDWLSEAVAECYLPLITVLRQLVFEKVPARLTIDISPVLCEMLAHPGFRKEFDAYTEQKITAARGDLVEFERSGAAQLAETARFWEKYFSEIRNQFQEINGDLIGELRELQDSGILEIMTCGATHGYFPLLSQDESLQLQVKLAVANYRKHFGRDPQGIWLPECAYRPRSEWTEPLDAAHQQTPRLRKGSDEFLAEAGLRFFLVDSHLITGGVASSVYVDRFAELQRLQSHKSEIQKSTRQTAGHQTNKPYLVRSGDESQIPVNVFGRDSETGLLVWSGEHGYPGDGRYLDFHKKRFPGGLRYWAVTSAKADLADKVEYVRAAAVAATSAHADDFVKRVSERLQEGATSDDSGILVAMYDTELFGHWWFEGPLFLDKVLRQLAGATQVRATALSINLNDHAATEILDLPEGSWGEGGGHTIWLNPETSWTWERIYSSERRMLSLLQRFYATYGETPNHRDEDVLELERTLKQALRELLLMSASDWQFLISTKSARDYAEKRFTNHHNDFCTIADLAETLLRGGNGLGSQWAYLEECEERDDLFQELDLRWYYKLTNPALDLVAQ